VGIAATGQIGSPTLKINSIVPIGTVAPAQGVVGSPTIRGSAVISVTGVAGSGETGNVLVWSKIIPDNNTIWTEIIAA